MSSRSCALHPTTECIYRFIVRFKRENGGDSPTLREIMAGVGLPTTSLVYYHLNLLEDAGKIVRPKRTKASRIAIPGAQWRFDEAWVDENEALKARVEKQEAIIESLSDQYTDAVLRTEEAEREYRQ